MSKPRHSRFVVDRREANTLSIQDENGVSTDVPVNRLPRECRTEGAILDVPISETGEPIWKEATRNRAVEAFLKKEANKRLEHLRKRDPGGDIEL
jgi:hypothetical protein